MQLINPEGDARVRYCRPKSPHPPQPRVSKKPINKWQVGWFPSPCLDAPREAGASKTPFPSGSLGTSKRANHCLAYRKQLAFVALLLVVPCADDDDCLPVSDLAQDIVARAERQEQLAAVCAVIHRLAYFGKTGEKVCAILQNLTGAGSGFRLFVIKKKAQSFGVFQCLR